MLIGRHSLLATTMVAQGFMGFDENVASASVADVDLAETGRIASLGNDGTGNEVFGAVFKHPEIAAKINSEIKAIKRNSDEDLKVIPLLPNLGSVPMFIALSKIPGMGTWFESLARSSLRKQKSKLFQKGRVLRTIYVTGLKSVVPPVAAKPQS